jgi:hypothetical protein
MNHRIRDSFYVFLIALFLGTAVCQAQTGQQPKSKATPRAPDQRDSFEASYLPFPRTAGERQKTGDPRKSIAERYFD